MHTTAVFPGSFNPFTIGHKSIVDRALGIFDRVVVAVGHNIDKPCDDTARHIEAIRRAFRDNSRVEVTSYSGLTAEFVKRIEASAILRGVRNIADFEYERNLADVNKEILGVETVLMFSLPEYSYITSSMVRELAANGHDVSSLLP